MKCYNGGSISNLVKYLDSTEIWVTDTVARAVRYANTQATGIVRSEMNQSQEEDTVILTIETSPRWSRRNENHATLDTCEDCVREYRIISATIRFDHNPRALYGPRGEMWDRNQVLMALADRGIKAEIIE